MSMWRGPGVAVRVADSPGMVAVTDTGKWLWDQNHSGRPTNWVPPRGGEVAMAGRGMTMVALAMSIIMVRGSTSCTPVAGSTIQVTRWLSAMRMHDCHTESTGASGGRKNVANTLVV